MTVSAIMEREGRFLVVEEHTRAGLRINTPAGHLEAAESPADGAAREALEETAHPFTPTALVGIYMATSDDAEGVATTWLRFAYCGTTGECVPDMALDTGIVRAMWLTLDELRACADRHRSPLVLQCIQDYLDGRRFPLDVVNMDASALPGGGWF